MKNNVMDKVAISNSHHPKSRFNLSHDVNSTYQFGEVQPVLCRAMIPDEKDVIEIESMVRLAPMVAPTFGRIKHKEWHHFIPMTDLFPHFGNLMAQTSYRGQSPTNLPQMTLGLLSSMCLIGSKMTIYSGGTYTGTDFDLDLDNYTLQRQPDVSTTTAAVTNVLNRIMSGQNTGPQELPFGFEANHSVSLWNVTQANTINFKYLLDSIISVNGTSHAWRQSMKIPVSNFDTHSWFDYVDKSIPANASKYVTDLDAVSLEAADCVAPYGLVDSNGTKSKYLLAFRFSNFGKRLYKILVGCGYQLNLGSDEIVSLMPLFAFFKAWYDSFGLTRYASWTDTQAYKLLSMYDYAPTNYNFDQVVDANIGNYFTWSDWIPFIIELGNAWVTEEVDFISGHTKEIPISPDASNAFFGKVENRNADALNRNLSVYTKTVPNTGLVEKYPVISDSSGNLSAANARLSALSVSELMKLYKWCNRNTVAGRQVEDLLRAQGYGYFLYSCKSNFIGYTEQDVQVYDVVNQSDTFNASSGDGMLLGEYAGRGLGYEKSKSMSFEADEHGYWIGLCAIVPQSGYSQGISQAVKAIDKWSNYNPDFDGLGFELSPKSVVCGSMPFQDDSARSLGFPFGFIPRYSGFKVARNVSNGGFSLRSQRAIFAPYMLDKVLNVGERYIEKTDETATYADFRVMKLFKSVSFPEAGDYWRFIGRYPWLGDLDRIFAHAIKNEDFLNQISQLMSGTFMDQSYEYNVSSDDNFMIHHVVNQQAYAPMLPIAETFGTSDEEDGSFNDSVKMN